MIRDRLSHSVIALVFSCSSACFADAVSLSEEIAEVWNMVRDGIVSAEESDAIRAFADDTYPLLYEQTEVSLGQDLLARLAIAYADADFPMAAELATFVRDEETFPADLRVDAGLIAARASYAADPASSSRWDTYLELEQLLVRYQGIYPSPMGVQHRADHRNLMLRLDTDRALWAVTVAEMSGAKLLVTHLSNAVDALVRAGERLEEGIATHMSVALQPGELGSVHTAFAWGQTNALERLDKLFVANDRVETMSSAHEGALRHAEWLLEHRQELSQASDELWTQPLASLALRHRWRAGERTDRLAEAVRRYSASTAPGLDFLLTIDELVLRAYNERDDETVVALTEAMGEVFQAWYPDTFSQSSLYWTAMLLRADSLTRQDHLDAAYEVFARVEIAAAENPELEAENDMLADTLPQVRTRLERAFNVHDRAQSFRSHGGHTQPASSAHESSSQRHATQRATGTPPRATGSSSTNETGPSGVLISAGAAIAAAIGIIALMWVRRSFPVS